MQDFVNYLLLTVVRSIYDSIDSAFDFWSIYNNDYNLFLDKNIFLDNSLIGLNLTYGELFRYVLIWVLVFAIIILFIKFICKIISLFRV